MFDIAARDVSYLSQTSKRWQRFQVRRISTRRRSRSAVEVCFLTDRFFSVVFIISVYKGIRKQTKKLFRIRLPCLVHRVVTYISLFFHCVTFLLILVIVGDVSVECCRILQPCVEWKIVGCWRTNANIYRDRVARLNNCNFWMPLWCTCCTYTFSRGILYKYWPLAYSHQAVVASCPWKF